jgi:hypothetical protein
MRELTEELASDLRRARSLLVCGVGMEQPVHHNNRPTVHRHFELLVVRARIVHLDELEVTRQPAIPPRLVPDVHAKLHGRYFLQYLGDATQHAKVTEHQAIIQVRCEVVHVTGEGLDCSKPAVKNRKKEHERQFSSTHKERTTTANKIFSPVQFILILNKAPIQFL